jgi:cobalamin synthase
VAAVVAVLATVAIPALVPAFHLDGNYDMGIAMMVTMACRNHDTAGRQTGQGQHKQAAQGSSNSAQSKLQTGHSADEATTGLAARR